jgi:hypothetical protein
MKNMSQSRRDAAADADTFMRVLGICYPASEKSYRAAYHAQWCASYALRFEDGGMGGFLYGRLAARAAFEAVPELRG